MRSRSFAIATGILVVAGTVSPAAYATGQNTLYVDGASSACTDSGTGTYAAPFCTIQAAANAADPGDVVSISRGVYDGNVTMTRSGTAAEPITFAGPATIVDTTAFVLDDANYVDLDGLRIDGGSAGAVVVEGGSNVALGGDTLVAYDATGPAVHVTGSAADVTVERSNLQGFASAQGVGAGNQVIVDGGSTGTVISTDTFDAAGEPVVVSGASGTDITSNTIGNECGIAVENNSADTTVENNVVYWQPGYVTCPTPAVADVGLLVDSSSTATTTADYNDYYPGVYNWGGTAYGTAAALYAATGQGQHDIDTTSGTVLAEHSAMINSANSSAPGELPTDYSNNARVIDPLVPQTGAGTYGYYDRGATQFQDPETFTESSIKASATRAPVGGTVTFTATAQDTWNDALTYDFVPGASGGVVPPAAVTSSTGTAPITFTAAADYLVDAQALIPGTNQASNFGSVQVDVVPAAPLTPVLGLSASGTTSVNASAADSTDSWNITGYSFDFGDGTPAVSSATDTAAHTYAKAGTYKVTVTETDAGGNTAATSSSFTTDAAPAGTLLQGTRSTSGSWGPAPWNIPPGSAGIAQAAATGMPDGSTQVAAVTTSGAVELNVLSSGGTWQGWQALSQPGVTVKSVSIAGMPNGSSQIVEVTSAGVLKHNIRNADGSWQASGWGSPAGSTGIAQAAITALPNGSTVLSAVLAGGEAESDQRNSNGSWQAWNTFDPTYLPDAAGADVAGLPNGDVQLIAVAGQ
jgi:PKD repeat protein